MNVTAHQISENVIEKPVILKASHPYEMPITAYCLQFFFSSSTVIIDEMFVNNGLVGVFNATELIYAVYKANKGGLDSLNPLYCLLCCVSSLQTEITSV